MCRRNAVSRSNSGSELPERLADFMVAPESVTGVGRNAGRGGHTTLGAQIYASSRMFLGLDKAHGEER
jgi:hypothetical protein